MGAHRRGRTKLKVARLVSAVQPTATEPVPPRVASPPVPAVQFSGASPSVRLLVKFPTRARPVKFLACLDRWLSLLSGKHPVEFVVSADDDDIDTAAVVSEVLRRSTDRRPVRVVVGPPMGKIDAVNRDLTGRSFDILIVASDDMVPQLSGYDDVVARDMLRQFPDFDGALHYNDGFRGAELCTLPILGRRLHEQWGYVYNPAYKSLWCDNEYTDLAKAQKRHWYSPLVLAKHEHPVYVLKKPGDELNRKNDSFWSEDRATYLARRRAQVFPGTVRESYNVISLSVFQVSPSDTRAVERYHDALPAVLRSIACLLAGWRVVIHHDGSIFRHRYGRALTKLAEDGAVDLREMPPAPLCKAMLWRMRPCWFPGANVVACRDLDALFLVRDRICLEEFLGSSSAVHNIKDNPGHVFPLMGGMSAYRAGAIRSAYANWDAFIASAGNVDWHRYGSDEHFLRQHVWPRFQDAYLNHDITGRPTASLNVSALPMEIRRFAERAELAPHVGVQTFDHQKVVDFYNDFPETTAIRRAESCR